MNLDTMLDHLIAGVRSMVAKSIKPIEDRLKAIEDQAKSQPAKTPSAEEVAVSMEPVFAKWALDFERKADDILQRSIDRIDKPQDGKDGKDAFCLDSFDCSLSEDGRTVTLSFIRGDDVISKSILLPTMLYRGVYSSKEQYSANDVVTYGGSMFIAIKDAPDGAPGVSDEWRLSVKRGRNGKDGRNGIDRTATIPAEKA